MKLSKVKIRNFRSIKDEELSFDAISDKNCHIFFGKNGAGKSSLLKAISLLDPQQKVKYNDDCEKEAGKNKREIELRYFFLMTENEIKTCFKNSGLPIDLIAVLAKSFLIVSKKFDHNSKVVTNYQLDLLDNQFLLDHYVFSEEKGSFHNKFVEKNVGRVIALTQDILDSVLVQHLQKFIPSIIPPVINWEAKDEYLINKPINLDSFKADKNSSIPLRNMFKISGISDELIDHRIDTAKTTSEGRIELEREIGECTTNYINKLWPEHKITFVVRIETNTCTVLISDNDKDKSMFKMNQRSDGFKHFISILLTLSAENSTDKLKNNIVLIDEPENSLHPSSIKYLRNELINISSTNLVLVSSHSIYFVDKLNIDRHLKVVKENGVSSFTRLSIDNPLQEEIIYEALGTSIYEFIEPNMIIFEGKTDKDLFDAITTRFEKTLKPVQLKTISAGSASKIHTYTKFFNNKSVHGFVVVDSDNEGRTVKTQVIENDASYNDTAFELSELCNLSKTSFTLEDLYPDDIVKEIVNELYGFIPSINDKIPILNDLKKQKKALKIDLDGKCKDLKSLLVNRIIKDFNNTKISQASLIEKYQYCYDFVSNLHRKVKE